VQGIEFLREYLHVSADTVPATLRKPTKAQPPHSFARPGAERGGRGFFLSFRLLVAKILIVR